MNRDHKMKISSNNGYSLAEVMIAAAILIVVIAGLIQLFVYTSALSDISKDTTTAVNEAQSKLEEIRNSNYAAITTNYASGGTPGNTFTPSAVTGKGIIYIDSSNSNLLVIEVDVSFRTRKGRVIGEDLDLDGVLDAGEDIDGNGHLDSPVKLISYLAIR